MTQYDDKLTKFCNHKIIEAMYLHLQTHDDEPNYWAPPDGMDMRAFFKISQACEQVLKEKRRDTYHEARIFVDNLVRDFFNAMENYLDKYEFQEGMVREEEEEIGEEDEEEPKPESAKPEPSEQN